MAIYITMKSMTDLISVANVSKSEQRLTIFVKRKRSDYTKKCVIVSYNTETLLYCSKIHMKVFSCY